MKWPVWVMALALGCLCATSQAQEGPPSALGAVAPNAGDVTMALGGGFFLNLPQGVAGLRVGTGLGSGLELSWQTVGFLGHHVSAMAGWGGALPHDLSLGFWGGASVVSLEAANDIAGLAFNSLKLGNGLIADGQLRLTWDRARSATVTLSMGFNVNLVEQNYTSFSEAEYLTRPRLRGLTAALQGEWPLAPRKHLFVKMDALLPLQTEIVPLGYLPSISAGVVWTR